MLTIVTHREKETFNVPVMGCMNSIAYVQRQTLPASISLYYRVPLAYLSLYHVVVSQGRESLKAVARVS